MLGDKCLLIVPSFSSTPSTQKTDTTSLIKSHKHHVGISRFIKDQVYVYCWWSEEPTTAEIEEIEAKGLGKLRELNRMFAEWHEAEQSGDPELERSVAQRTLDSERDFQSYKESLAPTFTEHSLDRILGPNQVRNVNDLR